MQSTDDLTGRQFGKYDVLERVGQGGMGVVYRAVDTTLGREVALKVLRPALARNADFVRRFYQEARTAANLEDHPNIVTIWEVGEAEGRPYISMEFLHGQTLSGIIRHRGALPIEHVLRLFNQIADALNYAHQQGVIHRDVKPSNIIVDQRGKVVLTDFGIAAAEEAAGGIAALEDRMGTPRYVAPEIALGRRASERSDVYSLGVVLYEMLTGRVPFVDRTTSGLIRAHIEATPPPPTELNPEISPAVERVVLRALNKQPTSRYRTPMEMADALRRAYAGVRDPILTPAMVLAGAGGLFAVVAIALLAWFVLGWGHTTPIIADNTATPTSTRTATPSSTPTAMPLPPTATPIPSRTHSLTPMAAPTDTSTPRPTSTLAPTDTPQPTSTPVPPTNTSIPADTPVPTSPPPPPTKPPLPPTEPPPPPPRPTDTPAPPPTPTPR